MLPVEVVQQFAAVQPPLAQLAPDSIGWRWEMNRGYVRVLLESDNKEVVSALCQTDCIVPRCALIESTRALLARKWLVEVEYIRREMNKVAYWLAA
ncbi:hypothetical protein V6N12_067726 [Hibiscus sabdariffa]|uniref:RNase H type-1 domain-containing protein n=1 Tax=Hibiscus sabdariffa TaxID=183260 RepID=A0ABR2FMT2_9ROSI